MSKNQIQIVANNYLLRYFKKIDLFKVELGSSLKQLDYKPGEAPKIKMKDLFVKKYENITNGNLIQKFGSIGSISFYEDNNLKKLEYQIYKNDQVFEIEAIDDDLAQEPKEYLITILKNIEKNKNIEIDDESGMIKNVIYTNIPEGMKIPDQNLPKEQYINAIVERRKLQEKLRKQNESK